MGKNIMLYETLYTPVACNHVSPYNFRVPVHCSGFMEGGGPTKIFHDLLPKITLSSFWRRVEFVEFSSKHSNILKSKSSESTSCNHNRIVFQEMSSWTALKLHLGITTTYYTKVEKQICTDFNMMILNFQNILRKCILTLD